MTLSEPYDQIAINDRGEEATWQSKEHPIARGFLVVDLQFSEGRYMAKLGSSDAS